MDIHHGDRHNNSFYLSGVLLVIMNILSTIFSNDSVGSTIDNIINSLAHPFFMVVFGLLFWFTLIWSLDMEKRKKLGVTFWEDQKDETVLAFIGALMFLIWDDEIIQGYYDWKGISGHPELKPYYYLIVAPVIDRIYWTVKKLRKNGHEST